MPKAKKKASPGGRRTLCLRPLLDDNYGFTPFFKDRVEQRSQQTAHNLPSFWEKSLLALYKLFPSLYDKHKSLVHNQG